MLTALALGLAGLLCGRSARTAGASSVGMFCAAEGAAGGSGAEVVGDGGAAADAEVAALGRVAGRSGGAATCAGGSGRGVAGRGSRHFITAKVIRKVSVAMARTSSRLRAAVSRGSLRSSSVSSDATAVWLERKWPLVVQRPRNRAKRLGCGRCTGLSGMAEVTASVMGAAMRARASGATAPCTGCEGLGGSGVEAGASFDGSCGR